MSIEPLRSRNVVQALTSGAPILTTIDALIERVGFGFGEVILQGSIKDARVSMPGLAHGLDLPGECAVVYARGLVDPQLGLRSLAVLLAFADRGIPQMVGGTLVDGTVIALDATLTAFDEGAVAFDDAPPRSVSQPSSPSRTVAAAAPSRPTAPAPSRPHAAPLPGVAPTQRPASAPLSGAGASTTPPVTAAPPPSTGWASAVAASNAPRPSTQASIGRTSRTQVEDESEDLRPGDLIIHPALGRCKVMAPPDSDKLRVRLPAGKLTELHLRVVKVTRSADEDGVRVFRATIGAQR